MAYRSSPLRTGATLAKVCQVWFSEDRREHFEFFSACVIGFILSNSSKPSHERWNKQQHVCHFSHELGRLAYGVLMRCPWRGDGYKSVFLKSRKEVSKLLTGTRIGTHCSHALCLVMSCAPVFVVVRLRGLRVPSLHRCARFGYPVCPVPAVGRYGQHGGRVDCPVSRRLLGRGPSSRSTSGDAARFRSACSFLFKLRRCITSDFAVDRRNNTSWMKIGRHVVDGGRKQFYSSNSDQILGRGSKANSTRRS